MRILVTGSTGFVGTALVNRLRDDRRFIARATVRRNDAILKSNIERAVVKDLSADTVWQSALSGVDVVVHLAARVHVMRDTATNPLAEFRRINVAGTLNLARQAAAAGVRRFIFVSSIKVNGEGTSLGRPYTINDTPMPIDPYGISKLEAETALRQLAAETGMDVVIIRPPLIYGPNIKGNFLTLLRWIDRGIPLPFANVDNRRSLLNIHNLIDLIIRCLDHPASAGKVLLASDGLDLSTRDLVRHLSLAMSKKPRLFPMPLAFSRSMFKIMRKEDLWTRLFGSLQVSGEETRSLLGWNPPVSALQGLAEVGRWYVESRNSSQ